MSVYNINKELKAMNNENIGMLDIWIDELVPCLRDNETNELRDTAVFKFESRSYLKNFTKKNGWHIDWSKIPKEVEVYALVLQGTNEIQGYKDADAVYMHWACAAPQNNKHDFGKQKYSGVGGHLFAVAIDKSIQWGHGGAVYGFAANEKLLEHYLHVFNGEYIGILHKYHFWIPEESALKIKEVYQYEWN